MTVKIENNNLVITLPINPHPSKSGKTTVIATTSGNKETDQIYQNKKVVIGVNAYIK